MAPDGLPLPPAEFDFLVSARRDLDPFQFLELGRDHAAEIISTLSRNGIEIDELEAILEFGCGCGRITRAFHFLKKAKVYGTDYNRRLIDWCRQCLPFAEFETNELSPPLAYRDAQFDFIYAYSVFTHLTESLQQRWLAELSRVLKPGGHLFLTTMGAAFAPEHLPPPGQRAICSRSVGDHGPRACRRKCVLRLSPVSLRKRDASKAFRATGLSARCGRRSQPKLYRSGQVLLEKAGLSRIGRGLERRYAEIVPMIENIVRRILPIFDS